MMGDANDSKTEIPVAESRTMPVVGGAAHKPCITAEGATPRHTQHIIRRGKVFSPVLHAIGIFEVASLQVLTPQALRPFPNIAAHIQHALGLAPEGKHPTVLVASIPVSAKFAWAGSGVLPQG